MSKKSKFKFIMISAMYENGGNTLQRSLDGHPQLYSYPFESQPGTHFVSDYLTSVFPQKYRWGQFPLTGNFADDYELIIDEELKRHLKTPFASKFTDAKMKMSDADRKKIFLKLLKGKDRTRGNILEAFFVSTFEAWKDYNRSGKEIAYVGYSPIIGVDGDKIIADYPDAQVLHIVRNPYSAYADTKKRPVPYSLRRYIHTWNIIQLYALTFANMYPKNFHVVKFEDMVADPEKFFKGLMKKLNYDYSEMLTYRSWNGRKLDITVPWGTIKTPTTKSNMETMKELSKEEIDQIKEQTMTINKVLGYDKL